MSFYKKETEKNELVAIPDVYQGYGMGNNGTNKCSKLGKLTTPFYQNSRINQLFKNDRKSLKVCFQEAKFYLTAFPALSTFLVFSKFGYKI